MAGRVRAPFGAIAVLAVSAVLFAATLLALAGALGAARSVDPPADADAWYLTLVDDEHPLPDGFAVDTVEVRGGERVDTRIAQALTEMFDAARDAGFHPFVRSGYRTSAEQEQILAERIAGYEAEGYGEADARDLALEWVARPGCSEHELGLAVDVNDEEGDGGLYDWLADHAHEYGFIQRYPPNKTDVTGIAHEPWHYRYVGVQAATEMHGRGIVLEEYLGI